MSFFAITSNHPRHVKFLETLYAKIDLDLVIIVEKKSENTIHEQQYFKSDTSLIESQAVLRCSVDELHTTSVLDKIRKINSSVGFVFGAPLLQESIFSIPKYGCVNIHTGLVEYYRGVDSVMWAMYDGRPDLIGSTLHYIDDTIDAGLVIDSKTVNVDYDDTLDTLFYKACQAGFDLLADNIDKIILNNIKKTKLKSKGTLYQNKDKSFKILSRAQENLRKYKSENYSRSL